MLTHPDQSKRPFSSGRLLVMGLAVLGLGVLSVAWDRFNDEFIPNGHYLRDDCLVFGGMCLLSSCIIRVATVTKSLAAGRVLLKAIFVAAVLYWVVWSGFVLQSETQLIIGALICLVYGVMLYPIWLVTWDCSNGEELRL